MIHVRRLILSTDSPWRRSGLKPYQALTHRTKEKYSKSYGDTVLVLANKRLIVKTCIDILHGNIRGISPQHEGVTKEDSFNWLPENGDINKFPCVNSTVNELDSINLLEESSSSSLHLHNNNNTSLKAMNDILTRRIIQSLHIMRGIEIVICLRAMEELNNYEQFRYSGHYDILIDRVMVSFQHICVSIDSGLSLAVLCSIFIRYRKEQLPIINRKRNSGVIERLKAKWEHNNSNEGVDNTAEYSTNVYAKNRIHAQSRFIRCLCRYAAQFLHTMDLEQSSTVFRCIILFGCHSPNMISIDNIRVMVERFRSILEEVVVEQGNPLDTLEAFTISYDSFKRFENNILHGYEKYSYPNECSFCDRIIDTICECLDLCNTSYEDCENKLSYSLLESNERETQEQRILRIVTDLVICSDSPKIVEAVRKWFWNYSDKKGSDKTEGDTSDQRLKLFNLIK